MITTTATQLAQTIQQHRNLQTIAAQADTIRAAADVLEQIHNSLATWTRIYFALEECLEDFHKQSLRQQVQIIQQQLNDSRARLEKNDFALRQALLRTQNGVDKLIQETEKYWTNYTVRRLRSPNQLFALARQLPNMQTQLPRMQELARELSARSQKLPATPPEVKKFHQLLNELDAKLSQLKGYTQTQTQFLDKLQRDAATLNDVDESLLTWCKQEGLASLLKIRLGE